jgi:hypothetical protein
MHALARALFPTTFTTVTITIALAASTFLLFILMILVVFLIWGLWGEEQALANIEARERCKRQGCERIGEGCICIAL